MDSSSARHQLQLEQVDHAGPSSRPNKVIITKIKKNKISAQSTWWTKLLNARTVEELNSFLPIESCWSHPGMLGAGAQGCNWRGWAAASREGAQPDYVAAGRWLLCRRPIRRRAAQGCSLLHPPSRGTPAQSYRSREPGSGRVAAGRQPPAAANCHSCRARLGGSREIASVRHRAGDVLKGNRSRVELSWASFLSWAVSKSAQTCLIPVSWSVRIQFS
jgi:hypothetical protein